ncbi:MAG: amidohydrolase family protein, partial [Candidatus Omnitrophica bacterium]|nr:amidohydrolase family protein [Candidatus Omnitrophota bacterium]
WVQMADRMSAAPARIMGLKNKGKIAEGMDADLTMIDPEQAWEVRKEDIVSKSKNSPYFGWKLQGNVVTTICGGKVTYQG